MFTPQPSATRRRVHRVAAAVLAAASIGSSAVLINSSPAEALTYHRWYIDANTVKVADAQEEDSLNPFKSTGDEVQLGVIAFNTVLGTPGSTNAWYVGNNLSTLCEGADDGKVCSVPDSAGRADFGYRRSLSGADIDKGYKPTVLGTIQVTIEEDGTPDSWWEDKFRELASITKQELAAASESLSSSDLDNLNEITARFKTAAQRIKDRVKIGWYDKVKVFVESLGDPDDKIDFQITALVAVENDLAPLVDAALANALGDDGVVGALRPRSVVQKHKGDGATYMVSSRVGTY